MFFLAMLSLPQYVLVCNTGKALFADLLNFLCDFLFFYFMFLLLSRYLLLLFFFGLC